MQVHKPMCLGLSCRPIQYRNKLGLSISAAIYVPFRHEAPHALWSEASMWRFLGSEMSEPLIDEGVLKTTPEYLVHAVAYPPERPALACAVRARVGAREKTLVVHGDREWRGQIAAPALPFESMPLDWSRAYGGADYPANPVGKGRPVASPAPQPLPNTEYAVSPIAKRDAESVPAGFGRLDPGWSTRAQHRGTYDERWLPEHAPGFPPDLNWRHFNLAPPDQWFNSPLGGDETFEFEHLHPTKKIVGGRLPGLRCRAFIRYKAGAHAGKLRDVPLQLSTLWFFPHAERCVLIFQGLADVAEDDGADVSTLMGAVERNGEPKSDEHYLQVLQRRDDAKLGGLYGLIESDLTPSGLDPIDPDMAAIEADYKIEGFQGEAQVRGAEVKVEKARARVKALGLDPDALGVRMPPREPRPTLSELPAYLEKHIVAAAQATQQAVVQAAKDIVAASQVAAKQGIDIRKAQLKGPPQFTAAGELHRLIATLPARPNPGAAADELLQLAPKLAQAEVAARMAYLISAHLQVRADPMPAAVAAEQRLRIAAAHAAGKSLAFLNLTGADLSGMDLSGANLHGSQLEAADLTGTKLVGANLTQAVLAHACLAGADFQDAKLLAANLGATTMPGASFAGADLSGAILGKADLDGASFRGAQLTGVQLLDTRFGACDWSTVEAPALHFIKADLSELVAEGADLSGGNFIECRLDGARFAGARLRGANFLTCLAVGTQWSGAVLAQAVFAAGCDLSRGGFAGADLTQANLRAARMGAAVLTAARLDGADLSEADLGSAELQGASLRGALLIRSELQHARLDGANLMNAVAQKADLRGTQLAGCNLFASRSVPGAARSRDRSCQRHRRSGQDSSEAPATAGGCGAMSVPLKPEQVVVLVHHGEPLSGLQLGPIRLARAPLRGAIFTNVALKQADLSNADLSEGFFERCDLSGCSLEGAKLRNAVFSRCTLDGVRAAGSSWHGAKLLDCSAAAADFGGADFSLAAFHRTRLDGANLNQARLDRVAFVDCSLKAAQLCRVAFYQATLSGLDLAGAETTGSTFELVVFHKTDLSVRSFAGQYLKGCQFIESPLAGADFAQATLRQCNFQGATLEGVSFAGAQAPQSIFVKATLSDCGFGGATLRQALFGEASLERCRFDGADLYQTYFADASLSQCSLRDCELTYADFSRARLVRCDGEGARVMRMNLHRAEIADSRLPNLAAALGTDPVQARAELWPQGA